MNTQHQARWVSKEKATNLRKTGALAHSLLIDSFQGFILVEPNGRQPHDAPILSPQEADYELRSAWCLSKQTKLAQARSLLGLGPEHGHRPAK